MAWQECSECRGCPASSYHRNKCRDDHNAHEEIEMMNEMERRHLSQLDLDREAEYLQGLTPDRVVTQ